MPLLVRLLAAVPLVLHAGDVAAQGEVPPPCSEDAMIVFDASGSMAGSLAEGIGEAKPRIDEVRKALGRVLPTVTQFRKVGLITYGPGPYRQCNVGIGFPADPRCGPAHHDGGGRP